MVNFYTLFYDISNIVYLQDIYSAQIKVNKLRWKLEFLVVTRRAQENKKAYRKLELYLYILIDKKKRRESLQLWYQFSIFYLHLKDIISCFTNYITSFSQTFFYPHSNRKARELNEIMALSAHLSMPFMSHHRRFYA